MPLSKTLKEGDRVRIGDAVLTVRKARKGAVRLVITAPRDVEIRDVPDEVLPHDLKLKPRFTEPVAALTDCCAQCFQFLGDPPHSSGLCGRCRKGLRHTTPDDMPF